MVKALTELVDRQGQGQRHPLRRRRHHRERRHARVGLASAIIIGFNVRPPAGACRSRQGRARRDPLYNIIYEAVDDVKKAMARPARADVPREARRQGRGASGLQIPKIGTIAGCMSPTARSVRDAQACASCATPPRSGRAASVAPPVQGRRREVAPASSAASRLEGFNDLKEGDVIECFEIQEVSASL